MLLSQETGQATSEVEGMVVSMMKTKLTVALVTAQYINFMDRQGSTYQVSGMGQLAIGRELSVGRSRESSFPSSPGRESGILARGAHSLDKGRLYLDITG